jgi:proline iminopeptidase
MHIIFRSAALAAAVLCAAAHAVDTAAMRPGEHQVVVNDVRLWYKVAGHGARGVPPLLFPASP